MNLFRGFGGLIIGGNDAVDLIQIQSRAHFVHSLTKARHDVADRQLGQLVQPVTLDVQVLLVKLVQLGQLGQLVQPVILDV